MKHNKLKNTGIIYEILCKKIMHETLDVSVPQSAINIVKKHFHKNSLLLKELKLYQELTQPNQQSDELINLIKEAKKSLDVKTLNDEKYNLVKSLKSKYNINEFYDSRVSNYKLLASIYNLLEHSPTDYPSEYLKNKKYIVECLQTPPTNIQEEILHEDKDIRRLSFKIIVEKFNEKYKTLSKRQKNLLSKFIIEDLTNDSFKNYVLTECDYIKKTLNTKRNKLTDPIHQIKLDESVKLLDNIIISPKIKEEHLTALLSYYELIDELK